MRGSGSRARQADPGDRRASGGPPPAHRVPRAVPRLQSGGQRLRRGPSDGCRRAAGPCGRDSPRRRSPLRVLRLGEDARDTSHSEPARTIPASSAHAASPTAAPAAAGRRVPACVPFLAARLRVEAPVRRALRRPGQDPCLPATEGSDHRMGALRRERPVSLRQRSYLHCNGRLEHAPARGIIAGIPHAVLRAGRRSGDLRNAANGRRGEHRGDLQTSSMRCSLLRSSPLFA